MPESDTNVVSLISAAPLPDKIPLAEASAADRFGHDKPTVGEVAGKDRQGHRGPGQLAREQ